MHVTDEDEYFPPPRELRELMNTFDVAAPALLGGPIPGSTTGGAFTDDRRVDAVRRPRRVAGRGVAGVRRSELLHAPGTRYKRRSLSTDSSRGA